MAIGKRSGRHSQQANDFLEPFQPTDLVLTDVGTARAYDDGAIELSFTLDANSPDATSYSIDVYDSITGQTTQVTGSIPDGNLSGVLPILVEGLSTGSETTMAVTLINDAGSSEVSATSSATTVTTVPDKPTITSLTNVLDRDFGDGAVDAAVFTSDNAVTVKFFDDSDDFELGFANVVDLPKRLSGNAKFNHHDQLSVYAIAYNENGESIMSDGVLVEVLTKPQVFTITEAADIGTNMPYNNGGVTISAFADGATSYEVYAGAQIIKTVNVGDFDLTGLSSYQVTNTGLLLSDTTYNFNVVAVNDQGTVASSNFISETITTVPDVPGGFYSSESGARTYNQGPAVLFHWTVPAGNPDTINLYAVDTANAANSWSATNTVTGQAVGTAGSQQMGFGGGWPNGINVNTYVTATNANGTSAASTTDNDTCRTKPQAGSISASNTSGTSTTTVTWSAGADGGASQTAVVTSNEGATLSTALSGSTTINQSANEQNTYTLTTTNVHGNAAATSGTVTTFGFTPFGFSPFGFSPFGFSPFGFSPFGFSPFGFTPFGFSPFGFIPFGFTPFGFSPFSFFGFTPVFNFFGFIPFGFAPFSFFGFTPVFSFFGFTPFSFSPFSFTPFSFAPFSFFGFIPFGFTPFSFTPKFSFFGFIPFGFAPKFSFFSFR